MINDLEAKYIGVSVASSLLSVVSSQVIGGSGTAKLIVNVGASVVSSGLTNSVEPIIIYMDNLSQKSELPSMKDMIGGCWQKIKDQKAPAKAVIDFLNGLILNTAFDYFIKDTVNEDLKIGSEIDDSFIIDTDIVEF